MKYMLDRTPKYLLAGTIIFLLIISGGLPSADASDSKATFTVQ
jgi:hypothetical protein